MENYTSNTKGKLMKSIILSALLCLSSTIYADEYKMVCAVGATAIDDLSAQATVMLKGGWRVSGTHTSSWVSLSMSTKLTLCQAFIKKDPPKPKPKLVKIFSSQCWHFGDGKTTAGVNEMLCEGWKIDSVPFTDLRDSDNLCLHFTKMVPVAEACPPQSKENK